MDGLKTGHTNEAGFCLVSSAKHDNMRLLAVVLNSPNDTARADDSERLLNYGFRFFETHALYKAGTALTELPLYKSQTKKMPIGLMADQYITIPAGQYQRLNISTKVPTFVEAPVKKGDTIGELIIKFDGNIIGSHPLYALQSAEKGGFFTCAKDSVKLMFKRWFGS